MEKITKSEQNYDNGTLSNAITTTLELEQNFKLFSFRIVDKDVFIKQVNDLIKNHQAREKALKTELERSLADQKK